MRRHTQVILSHLLPVVFWLLAIGGSLVPALLSQRSGLTGEDGLTSNYYFGYLVTAFVLTVIVIIGRIKRHTSSIEECFQMALLLGIASYWLPTVLFLTLPFWIYLFSQNLFSFRAFMATLIGYAVVAIWAAIFIVFGWIANPWAHFFAIENAWGWIPTGAILLAWLASTIARRILRVR